MKKKLIAIVVGLLLVGGLAYLAFDLQASSKATDTSLIAFAIEDTASVDRIELYDSFLDIEFTLVRGKNGVWTGEDGMCVQQSIVNMMLETMNKITLRGYVPKSAMDNMKKIIMAQHKTVKIFQNGKWVKTWYVGHSTQNHMGTHMLLETPKIKSDNPVIMGMKGFYGILEPRFFADARKFACTDLFSYKRDEIKSVEVTNRVTPSESYKIVVNNADDYEVSSQGSPILDFNKENLVYYLNGFDNIHFNQPNYTMSEKEIDSLKRAVPDYEIQVHSEQKDDYHLKLYRRLDVDYDPRDTIAYDQTYMWGIKQDGELVRIQYYVVGPLLFGKVVFVE
ncbi:MAG: hypothetical protein WC994_09970 [Brumimicrobium sp.]